MCSAVNYNTCCRHKVSLQNEFAGEHSTDADDGKIDHSRHT